MPLNFETTRNLLKAQIPTSRVIRIENAYEDLAIIYELFNKSQADAANTNLSDPDSPLYMRRLAVLLKALYIFADQFITSMLSEVVGELQLTLNAFLRKSISLIKGF